MEHTTHTIEFDDNQRLSALVGAEDQHLRFIESRLGVDISLRGNIISVKGADPEATFAKTVLTYLYAQLPRIKEIKTEDMDEALRLASAMVNVDDPMQKGFSQKDSVSIPTKRKVVFPKSANQAGYIEAMQQHELVFGVGPAGTGKTYLAVAMAVSMLLEGKIDRIILSRPAVEAGEKLGFLPGDMREKVDPYLRPLYDALNDLLPGDQVIKRLSTGEIEIAPLAFMRGRTLSNAFVILDEAQNTTAMQMKMFLTRLGPNSRMVVTGDLTQVDLPYGVKSGLKDALHILHNVEGVGITFFNDEDVIRHPLVARIVRAYQDQP